MVLRDLAGVVVACKTCHLRSGLGMCTPCTVRAQKGLDGLDEFMLLMNDYLEWGDKQGTRGQQRAGLLHAWVQGKDVDLVNAPLLTPNSQTVGTLFALYQEATGTEDAQMADIKARYQAWVHENTDNFWMQQVGSHLLVAVKLDEGQTINMWYSALALDAEVSLPRAIAK